MSNIPSLHEFQIWMKWIITDPRGVSGALGEPKKSLLELIENHGTDAIERLDIYAEAYFSRILDCLSDTFAMTKKAVGESAFKKLTVEYLKVYPSKFYTIDEVACQFATFLKETNVLKLTEWIADLARFEWSWIECFYSRDMISSKDWQTELAENPERSLQVHPTVRLMKSRWPLRTTIKNFESNHKFEQLECTRNNGSNIVIYRLHDEVLWEEIDPRAFQILENIISGQSLDRALEEIQDLDPQRVALWFRGWVERGILCG